MAFHSNLLNMFARSPIRPLQKHMEKVFTCANLLKSFFDNIIEDHWEVAQDLQIQILDAEEAANRLKMDLRIHLPKTLFLPFDRNDLFEILHHQEMIADTSKNIANVFLARKMQIPKSMKETFTTYLSCCVAAVGQAKKAINELDELLEAGFRGKEINLVINLIQELNKIEHESDRMQIKTQQSLFAIENTMQPVDIIFMYKIIDWIGMLATSAQKIGTRLQILSA